MTRNRKAFTLVEMLVVLGIIVLLVSLLLPVITKARRASEVTKCLSQLRELGVATQQYLNDNENTFPDASTGNDVLSVYSPRGLNDLGMSAYQAWDPIPKPGTGAASGKWGPGAYCMPSIGQMYAKYLTTGAKIWKCPSQGVLRAASPSPGVPDPTMFILKTAEAGGDVADVGAMSGSQFTDEFRPGYRYMGTKELYYYTKGAGSGGSSNHPVPLGGGKYYAMLERNIAGLTLSQVEGSNPQMAARVVLFTDYSTRVHSNTNHEVLELSSSDGSSHSAHYKANFVYLDGHAETKEFGDVDSYLQLWHPAIRQYIFGSDVQPEGTQ